MKNNVLGTYSRFTLFFVGTLFSAPCAKIQAPQPTKTFQEEAIIQEIKSLLEHGTVPSLGFKTWVDNYAPVLSKSEKKTLRKLGQTLQTIRQGNVANIDAFNVLPDFEKAVQEYDKRFYISTFYKPIIIAKGSYWYFLD